MKVQPEWMLTNKEIHKALGLTNNFESLCKSQARKIVEWLRQPCKHREQPLADVPMSHGCRVIIMRYYRGDCPICMEQLRKEVEL